MADAYVAAGSNVRPRESLATRLERSMAKLTALRAGATPPVPTDLLNGRPPWGLVVRMYRS